MKISPVKIGVIVVMLGILAGVAVGIVLLVTNKSAAEQITFSNDFKIGAASASYQIEGGWDEDGKSPNVWDTLTHRDVLYTADRSNGDVAADSYHMVDKDVDALVNIGFDLYRFSISWSRIIPDGSKTNMKGIEYYNNLINKLIAKNIVPYVTIFHWDLPQYIQDLGGWTNPLVVDYYKHYADVLFQHFGDRVKVWITMNEPAVFCGEGYGYTTKAPAIASPGVGDYLCNHHVLLAHAAAYRLYKEKYFATQNGKVGICLNSGFSYAGEGQPANITDKALDFELGKYANPIWNGGYPQVMVDELSRKSLNEGRPWSRLPEMTREQNDLIKGSSDFLALNYYTSRMVSARVENPDLPISWWADTNIDGYVDPTWKQAKSEWLYSVPEGLHDLLNWIKDKYGNPEVMISENGWSDDGEIEDDGRVEYLKAHLTSVAKAIDDGCKVSAYMVWSLTDNFEWKMGYTEKFGIHYINFYSKAKERVPKKSALFFKEMMKTKSFDNQS